MGGIEFPAPTPTEGGTSPMHTRSRNDVEKVQWGGGMSERIVTAQDLSLIHI